LEIYLVGGAVRDSLLGLPTRERDWVVVGSTPQEMLRLGYRQVGRDFPVFLHPITREEYALARTERKVGPGHTGFVCHAGADVTLEDDLRRRDLTINAIARDANDALIDPWSGAVDLAARRLRHVSPAFVEDPLRVFRVARFAAQLGAFGFEVVPDTMALMTQMCERDLVGELAPERVWQELVKALSTEHPEMFFEVLRRCGGLERWFPEFVPLTDLEPFLRAHAGNLRDPLARFAMLGWLVEPSAVRSLSERLRAPTEFRRAAGDVARYGRQFVGWRRAASTDLLASMKSAGVLRQPDWFAFVVGVAAECASADLSDLVELGARIRDIASAPLRDRGLNGVALGEALDGARLALIRESQR